MSYEIKEGVKHKCGHGQCSNCLEYVDLYHHECYIVSDCYRENKRSDNKRMAEERSLEAIKTMTTDDGHMVKDIVHRPITFKEKSEEDRRDLQDREESGEELVMTVLQEDDGDWVKRELLSLGVDITTVLENKLDDCYFTHCTREGSPTEKELVSADIECEIDDSRTFTLTLSAVKENPRRRNISFGKKGKQLHIFFHNFRGFDGWFIIKQLYDMNLKVSKVRTTGQKILYFECGNLKCKDSMSFLNMPFSPSAESREQPKHVTC